MAERYAGRVAFFVVYIKEAHPEDGWVLDTNRSEQIAVDDPASTEARAEVAKACSVRLRIRMPVLIDGSTTRLRSGTEAGRTGSI